MPSTLDQDPRYQEALAAMQEGDWSRAHKLLEDLTGDYPDDPVLKTLKDEIAYKSDLNRYWNSRLSSLFARWPQVNSTRILRWVVSLAVLAAIALLIANINQRLLRPQFAVQAEATKVAALVTQGDRAFASGDYQQAGEYYQQAQALSPDDPEIAAAIEATHIKAEAAQKYEEAMKAIDNLNYTQARQLLQEVQQLSPHYSNVDELLPQIKKQEEMQTWFYNAELAYERKEWEKAIANYENILATNITFHGKNVKEHLIDSYSHLAQQKLQPDSLTVADVDTAIDLLRKIVRLAPDNRTALDQITQLALYRQAAQALQQQNDAAAVPILEQLNAQAPAILGDHVNRDLYRAYLSLGDEALAAGDNQLAADYYTKASNVPGIDTGEAQLRLEVAMVSVPPTATPTPTPTPTPAPPTPTPVLPTPTPVPTATPAPITWYKGWIAFLSDRDGDEGLYVMRPDGKGVRRLYDDDKELYDEIYKKEQKSPDGTTRVYAEAAGNGRKDTNIYIFRDDLPEGWERRFMLTDWGSMEYDPVWAPNGQAIAFVSNKTGNDEIWIMWPDGTHKQQLTVNDWEWDKHPTWSPDGKYIAFYSNSQTQIWVMNADGTAQQNISNNQYNDWDPVWIK